MRAAHLLACSLGALISRLLLLLLLLIGYRSFAARIIVVRRARCVDVDVGVVFFSNFLTSSLFLSFSLSLSLYLSVFLFLSFTGSRLLLARQQLTLYSYCLPIQPPPRQRLLLLLLLLLPALLLLLLHLLLLLQLTAAHAQAHDESCCVVRALKCERTLKRRQANCECVCAYESSE